YIDKEMALSLKSNIGLGWMVGVGIAIILKEILPNFKTFVSSFRLNSKARSSKKTINYLTPVMILIALYFIFIAELPFVAVLITLAGTWLSTAMSSQCVGQSSINPMEVFGIITMALVKVVFPEMPMLLLVSVAAVVAIASGLTGDLMNDYKSGQVFNTSPQAQWIAEMIGCIVGAVVVSVIFFVLVQAFGGSIFGSDTLPAAQSVAVAQLAGGVDNPYMFFGSAAVSILIYFISPKFTMLGLGIYLPANLTISMFLGAIVRLGFNFICSRFKKRDKKDNALIKIKEEGSDIIFAAGILAGEGVVGIVITLIQSIIIIMSL
ncbi:MAG: OPT/YSL family transporter, partial [Enterococcus sp.]|nr:OPT/YSL family transporter [Enterococcus sp.]